MNTISAYARYNDPETAHQAAESVKTTELESIVLNGLKNQGEFGATTHELSQILNLELVTVSPRLKPLMQKGLVMVTNKRRIGSSGRKSIVWKAIIKK